MAPRVLLFAYGTLLRGHRADLTKQYPGTEYIADASLRGTLLDLGECPGLIAPGEGPPVRGELFSVPTEVLDDIDEYERTCGNYMLMSCPVRLDNGVTITADVYVLKTMGKESFPVIEQGCWRTYCLQRDHG